MELDPREFGIGSVNHYKITAIISKVKRTGIEKTLRNAMSLVKKMSRSSRRKNIKLGPINTIKFVRIIIV